MSVLDYTKPGALLDADLLGVTVHLSASDLAESLRRAEERRAWAMRYLRCGFISARRSTGASDLAEAWSRDTYRVAQRELNAQLQRIARSPTRDVAVPLKREVMPARPRVLLASPDFLVTIGIGLALNAVALVTSWGAW